MTRWKTYKCFCFIHQLHHVGGVKFIVSPRQFEKLTLGGAVIDWFKKNVLSVSGKYLSSCQH